MAAIVKNFTLFKNRYNPIQFTVMGVPNLVGWKVRWTLAPLAGESTVIDKDSDVEDVEINGVVVSIDIWPANTSELDTGTYYHELTLIDPDDNERVAAFGNEVILRDTSDIS